jgi:hypothetical protein
MTMNTTAGIVLGGVVLVLLFLIFLAGNAEYPDTDSADIDRDQLFRTTEQLLKESEDWPAELTAGSVVVASSLDPYPVRTVVFTVDVDADIEKVIEYVKEENYSGPGRTDKPDKDKYEVMLYQKDNAQGPTEWVRRSVHLSPPPGGDRDAVVMYFEDRPDPKTYRIAFQSIETIDGKGVPEVEGAVRFKVLASMYKVEETAPGKVRIRKVEAVDPKGSMSTLMNNHVLSRVFFRSYMFEQAKEMQVNLTEVQG